MASRVARQIIERQHDGGTWLTEADIALADGASRTPAREAMLLLNRWGLVRLLPKKGAIVTTVTPEERRDLLAFRAMLETNAVQLLENGTAVWKDLGRDLDVILENQRAALTDHALLSFASYDYAFHARIINAAGNGVVGEVLDSLEPRFARLTYLAVTENPDRLPTLLREHSMLAERARDSDSAGFAQLVLEHIESGHFRTGINS